MSLRRSSTFSDSQPCGQVRTLRSMIPAAAFRLTYLMLARASWLALLAGSDAVCGKPTLTKHHLEHRHRRRRHESRRSEPANMAPPRVGFVPAKWWC